MRGSIIESLATGRVLVVGDVMLDRYWQGDVERISPEAPVPVVRVAEQANRAGGAANVALNLATLQAQVKLLGWVGDDSAAVELNCILENAAVSSELLTCVGWKTISKLRVLGAAQQLLRLDFEQSLLGDDEQLVARYSELLADVSCVVLSDYCKGALRSVAKLISLARAKGLPVLVDPKGCDFSIYRGATMLTPNRREFEMIVGVCKDLQTCESRGRELMAQMQWEALLITLGSEGMLLLQHEQPACHFPAKAREVFDVTGAGDTVIATLAAAVAGGQDLLTAVELANIAAGLVVAKVGSAAVSLDELSHAQDPSRMLSSGVHSEDKLLPLIAAAKARGERVVMTNGCFDVLHAGHIQYLAQAKALGDRLLIAVNDDASVRRLKGNTRPINSLAERMDVLAALGCVDWVVAFSEQTPERLVGELLPDVLVKGGDYCVAEVAGAAAVMAAGGEVQILPFKPGCSSSRIIAAMDAEMVDV